MEAADRKELYEAILIVTKDGCLFPGVIHHSPNKTKKIAIFIHGNGGNFYKIEYLKYISDELLDNDIDFMTANNRGSDQSVRIHKKINGVTESVKGGCIYENFDESIFDVDGAVQYARKCGYEDIYLIGESLGSVKIQYYSNTISDVNKIILISPVDMISRFRSRVKEKYDELIEKSKECVQNGNKYEMITDEYSAIKIASTMAVGSNADIFKLEQERISNMPLNFTGNVSVIVGTEDHCNKQWGLSHVEYTLRNQFNNAKFSFHAIQNADHMFKGYENQLASKVLECVLDM